MKTKPFFEFTVSLKCSLGVNAQLRFENNKPTKQPKQNQNIQSIRQTHDEYQLCRKMSGRGRISLLTVVLLRVVLRSGNYPQTTSGFWTGSESGCPPKTVRCHASVQSDIVSDARFERQEDFVVMGPQGHQGMEGHFRGPIHRLEIEFEFVVYADSSARVR
jgi:hypothetical protein